MDTGVGFLGCLSSARRLWGTLGTRPHGNSRGSLYLTVPGIDFYRIQTSHIKHVSGSQLEYPSGPQVEVTPPFAHMMEARQPPTFGVSFLTEQSPPFSLSPLSSPPRSSHTYPSHSRAWDWGTVWVRYGGNGWVTVGVGVEVR